MCVHVVCGRDLRNNKATEASTTHLPPAANCGLCVCVCVCVCV